MHSDLSMPVWDNWLQGSRMLLSLSHICHIQSAFYTLRVNGSHFRCRLPPYCRTFYCSGNVIQLYCVLFVDSSNLLPRDAYAAHLHSAVHAAETCLSSLSVCPSHSCGIETESIVKRGRLIEDLGQISIRSPQGAPKLRWVGNLFSTFDHCWLYLTSDTW